MGVKIGDTVTFATSTLGGYAEYVAVDPTSVSNT
eukprot:UN18647